MNRYHCAPLAAATESMFLCRASSRLLFSKLPHTSLNFRTRDVDPDFCGPALLYKYTVMQMSGKISIFQLIIVCVCITESHFTQLNAHFLVMNSKRCSLMCNILYAFLLSDQGQYTYCYFCCCYCSVLLLLRTAATATVQYCYCSVLLLLLLLRTAAAATAAATSTAAITVQYSCYCYCSVLLLLLLLLFSTAATAATAASVQYCCYCCCYFYCCYCCCYFSRYIMGFLGQNHFSPYSPPIKKEQNQ